MSASQSSTGVSTVLFLPIAVLVLVDRQPDAFTVLCAITAGVLASVVPFVADLPALRRVRPASSGFS